MDQFFFYQLIDRYLDGTASEEERRFVEACYEALSGQDGKTLSAGQTSDLRERLYKGVLAGGGLKAGISLAGGVPLEQDVVRMRQEEGGTSIGQSEAGTPLVVRPRKFWPDRRMAAAVLVALLGVFCWLILSRKHTGPDITGLSRIERYRNDVIPAHQGVTLTLADGVQIPLDSAANGHLTVQGGTQVVKQDSALFYTTGKNQGESPRSGVSRETTGRPQGGGLFYNTVTTGKGHIFQLRLPDGTGVWLDAMSSIQFPTSFSGQERVVTVAGQAYFEVARDKRRPFRVVTGNQTVEVLGTHFNINAYAPVIKTTLLEGTVRVSAGGSHPVLSPGEQAQSGAGDRVRVMAGADLEDVVAWKNGRFRFNGSSMEEIMQQVTRWYDIDVVYHDSIPETFVAKISRNVPISRLLDLLEMTQQVAFTVEGNKVTVWSRHGKKK